MKKISILLVAFKCFSASLLTFLILSPINGYVSFHFHQFLTSISYFLISVFLVKHFSDKVSIITIILSILAGSLLLDLPIRILYFSASLSSLLDSIIYKLGIIFAWLFIITKNKFKWFYPSFGFLIILYVFFWGYDLWLFKLSHGSFTGNVNFKQPIEISGKTQTGEPIANDLFNNKVVVLDFWSTSCGNCFKEFPIFQKVYDKYKDNGSIELFAVNLPNKRDTLGQAIAMINKQNYHFPLLFPANDTLLSHFGANAVPTVIIINKQKDVIYRGNITKASKIIDKLMSD